MHVVRTRLLFAALVLGLQAAAFTERLQVEIVATGVRFGEGTVFIGDNPIHVDNACRHRQMAYSDHTTAPSKSQSRAYIAPARSLSANDAPSASLTPGEGRRKNLSGTG
jgi:hypothetical protein